MKKQGRIEVKSQAQLNSNPFDQVDFSKMQLINKDLQKEIIKEPEITVIKKGRVDVRREKTGRGGKIVTVVEGIDSCEERKLLLKRLQKQVACGGTIKNESLEIQGDKRDEIAKELRDLGYRVVFAGG